MKNKKVLSIVGNDIYSAGGLYSDIRILGQVADVYLAITCLTACPQGDFQIIPVACDALAQQLASFDDLDFDLIKIGLLPSVDHARLVFDWLKGKKGAKIFLDPVLLLKEKEGQANQEIVDLLRDFLPFVDLMTPNLLEAQILLGRELTSQEDIQAGAQELRGLGAKIALITVGDRLAGTEALDVYADEKQTVALKGPLVHLSNEGAGCTFLSYLTKEELKGSASLEAAQKAKEATYHYLLERDKHATTK